MAVFRGSRDPAKERKRKKRPSAGRVPAGAKVTPETAQKLAQDVFHVPDVPESKLKKPKSLIEANLKPMTEAYKAEFKKTPTASQAFGLLSAVNEEHDVAGWRKFLNPDGDPHRYADPVSTAMQRFSLTYFAKNRELPGSAQMRAFLEARPALAGNMDYDTLTQTFSVTGIPSAYGITLDKPLRVVANKASEDTRRRRRHRWTMQDIANLPTAEKTAAMADKERELANRPMHVTGKKWDDMTEEDKKRIREARYWYDPKYGGPGTSLKKRINMDWGAYSVLDENGDPDVMATRNLFAGDPTLDPKKNPYSIIAVQDRLFDKEREELNHNDVSQLFTIGLAIQATYGNEFSNWLNKVGGWEKATWDVEFDQMARGYMIMSALPDAYYIPRDEKDPERLDRQQRAMKIIELATNGEYKQTDDLQVYIDQLNSVGNKGNGTPASEQYSNLMFEFFYKTNPKLSVEQAVIRFAYLYGEKNLPVQQQRYLESLKNKWTVWEEAAQQKFTGQPLGAVWGKMLTDAEFYRSLVENNSPLVREDPNAKANLAAAAENYGDKMLGKYRDRDSSPSPTDFAVIEAATEDALNYEKNKEYYPSSTGVAGVRAPIPGSAQLNRDQYQGFFNILGPVGSALQGGFAGIERFAAQLYLTMYLASKYEDPTGRYAGDDWWHHGSQDVSDAIIHPPLKFLQQTGSNTGAAWLESLPTRVPIPTDAGIMNMGKLWDEAGIKTAEEGQKGFQAFTDTVMESNGLDPWGDDKLLAGMLYWQWSLGKDMALDATWGIGKFVGQKAALQIMRSVRAPATVAQRKLAHGILRRLVGQKAALQIMRRVRTPAVVAQEQWAQGVLRTARLSAMKEAAGASDLAMPSAVKAATGRMRAGDRARAAAAAMLERELKNDPLFVPDVYKADPDVAKALDILHEIYGPASWEPTAVGFSKRVFKDSDVFRMLGIKDHFVLDARQYSKVKELVHTIATTVDDGTNSGVDTIRGAFATLKRYGFDIDLSASFRRQKRYYDVMNGISDPRARISITPASAIELGTRDPVRHFEAFLTLTNGGFARTTAGKKQGLEYLRGVMDELFAIEGKTTQQRYNQIQDLYKRVQMETFERLRDNKADEWTIKRVLKWANRAGIRGVKHDVEIALEQAKKRSVNRAIRLAKEEAKRLSEATGEKVLPKEVDREGYVSEWDLFKIIHTLQQKDKKTIAHMSGDAVYDEFDKVPLVEEQLSKNLPNGTPMQDLVSFLNGHWEWDVATRNSFYGLPSMMATTNVFRQLAIGRLLFGVSAFFMDEAWRFIPESLEGNINMTPRALARAREFTNASGTRKVVTGGNPLIDMTKDRNTYYRLVEPDHPDYLLWLNEAIRDGGSAESTAAFHDILRDIMDEFKAAKKAAADGAEGVAYDETVFRTRLWDELEALVLGRPSTLPSQQNEEAREQLGEVVRSVMDRMNRDIDGDYNPIKQVEQEIEDLSTHKASIEAQIADQDEKIAQINEQIKVLEEPWEGKESLVFQVTHEGHVSDPYDYVPSQYPDNHPVRQVYDFYTSLKRSDFETQHEYLQALNIAGRDVRREIVVTLRGRQQRLQEMQAALEKRVGELQQYFGEQVYQFPYEFARRWVFNNLPIFSGGYKKPQRLARIAKEAGMTPEEYLGRLFETHQYDILATFRAEGSKLTKQGEAWTMQGTHVRFSTTTRGQEWEWTAVAEDGTSVTVVFDRKGDTAASVKEKLQEMIDNGSVDHLIEIRRGQADQSAIDDVIDAAPEPTPRAETPPSQTASTPTPQTPEPDIPDYTPEAAAPEALSWEERTDAGKRVISVWYESEGKKTATTFRIDRADDGRTWTVFEKEGAGEYKASSYFATYDTPDDARNAVFRMVDEQDAANGVVKPERQIIDDEDDALDELEDVEFDIENSAHQAILRELVQEDLGSGKDGVKALHDWWKDNIGDDPFPESIHDARLEYVEQEKNERLQEVLNERFQEKTPTPEPAAPTPGKLDSIPEAFRTVDPRELFKALVDKAHDIPYKKLALMTVEDFRYNLKYISAKMKGTLDMDEVFWAANKDMKPSRMKRLKELQQQMGGPMYKLNTSTGKKPAITKSELMKMEMYLDDLDKELVKVHGISEDELREFITPEWARKNKTEISYPRTPGTFQEYIDGWNAAESTDDAISLAGKDEAWADGYKDHRAKRDKGSSYKAHSYVEDEAPSSGVSPEKTLSQETKRILGSSQARYPSEEVAIDAARIAAEESGQTIYVVKLKTGSHAGEYVVRLDGRGHVIRSFGGGKQKPRLSRMLAERYADEANAHIAPELREEGRQALAWYRANETASPGGPSGPLPRGERNALPDWNQRRDTELSGELPMDSRYRTAPVAGGSSRGPKGRFQRTTEAMELDARQRQLVRVNALLGENDARIAGLQDTALPKVTEEEWTEFFRIEMPTIANLGAPSKTFYVEYLYENFPELRVFLDEATPPSSAAPQRAMGQARGTSLYQFSERAKEMDIKDIRRIWRKNLSHDDQMALMDAWEEYVADLRGIPDQLDELRRLREEKRGVRAERKNLAKQREAASQAIYTAAKKMPKLSSRGEQWIAELVDRMSVYALDDELFEAFMSKTPLTKKQLAAIRTRVRGELGRLDSAGTPIMYGGGQGIGRTANDLPMVMGVDPGASGAEQGAIPILTPFIEKGVAGLPGGSVLEQKAKNLPGIAGRVAHAAVTLSPFSVLDAISTKARDTMFLARFDVEYNKLVAAGVQAGKGGEAHRLAEIRAMSYIEDAQYSSLQTPIEHSLKPVFMFLPAYKQAALYWMRQFNKHPFMYYDIRRAINSDYTQLHVGPTTMPFPFKPFWAGATPAEMMMPGVTAPILIPLRMANAATAWTKNEETGGYDYTGVGKLDKLSSFPPLAFMDKSVSPMNWIDDLFYGFFGDTIQPTHANDVFAGGLYSVVLAMQKDPYSRRRMSMSLLQSQLAMGLRPDLKAADRALAANPGWINFFRNLGFFKRPEVALQFLGRQVGLGRINYMPSDIGDINYEDGDDPTLWNKIFGDDEAQTIADAQYEYMQAMGDPVEQDAIEMKYPKLKAINDFMDMDNYEKAQYLSVVENRWVMPYVVGKNNYSTTGRMLTSQEYYTALTEGAILKRTTNEYLDGFSKLDINVKADDVLRMFAADKERMVHDAKSLIEKAALEIWGKRFAPEKIQKYYDQVEFDWYNRTVPNRTEGSAPTPIPNWLDRYVARHNISDPLKYSLWHIDQNFIASSQWLVNRIDENAITEENRIDLKKAGLATVVLSTGQEYGPSSRGVEGYYDRPILYDKTGKAYTNGLGTLVEISDVFRKLLPEYTHKLLTIEGSASRHGINQILKENRPKQEYAALRMATDPTYFRDQGNPAKEYMSAGIKIDNPDKFNDMFLELEMEWTKWDAKRNLPKSKGGFTDKYGQLESQSDEYSKAKSSYEKRVKDIIIKYGYEKVLLNGTAGRLSQTYLVKQGGAKPRPEYVKNAVKLMRDDHPDVEKVVSMGMEPRNEKKEAALAWQAVLAVIIDYRMNVLPNIVSDYTHEKGVSPGTKQGIKKLWQIDRLAKAWMRKNKTFKRQWELGKLDDLVHGKIEFTPSIVDKDAT